MLGRAPEAELNGAAAAGYRVDVLPVTQSTASEH